MLLPKPKQSKLNQSTSGILLPYLPKNSPSSPGKPLASHSLTSPPQTPSHCLKQISLRYYCCSLIASSSSNPHKLWNSINALLDRMLSPLLPSLASFSSQSLLQMFATFFSDKILKLHTALKSSSTVSSPHFPPKTLLPYIISFFSLVSEDEVSKIISESCNSFSDLYPIPDSYISPQTMPICTPIYLD